jgi:hypothetical protein
MRAARGLPAMTAATLSDADMQLIVQAPRNLWDPTFTDPGNSNPWVSSVAGRRAHRHSAQAASEDRRGIPVDQTLHQRVRDRWIQQHCRHSCAGGSAGRLCQQRSVRSHALAAERNLRL